MGWGNHYVTHCYSFLVYLLIWFQAPQTTTKSSKQFQEAKNINPNYPEVFSKRFIPGGIHPPPKFHHIMDFANLLQVLRYVEYRR